MSRLFNLFLPGKFKNLHARNRLAFRLSRLLLFGLRCFKNRGRETLELFLLFKIRSLLVNVKQLQIRKGLLLTFILSRLNGRFNSDFNDLFTRNRNFWLLNRLFGLSMSIDFKRLPQLVTSQTNFRVFYNFKFPVACFQISCLVLHRLRGLRSLRFDDNRLEVDLTTL